MQTISLPPPKNECQRSINDFQSYTFSNHTWCIVPYCQRQTIGRLVSWKGKRYTSCRIIKMSINGASTILRLATWIIPGLLIEIVTEWSYWLPFSANMMQTISLPLPKHERQQSVNDYWSCILNNPRAVQRLYSITNTMAAIMGSVSNASR